MKYMTALGTSLALPLFNMESVYHEPVRGFKILILLAVRKCIREQYVVARRLPSGEIIYE